MHFPADFPTPLADLGTLWTDRRGGRLLPARADFQTAELWRWAGHLNLLDVIDQGADFRYRVYGSSLATLFGVELTGKTVADLAETTRPSIPTYCAVVLTRQPCR